MEKQLTVKLIRTQEHIKIPQYKTKGAAAFDFEADKDYTLMPGEIKMVGTGLKVEVPEGFEIQVRPRSGLAIDKSITVMNSPGTIDSDFRGEIMIILANFGNENFYINKGDRIAQGALCPVYKAMFVEAELSTTERGEGGFGSTGVTSY